MYADRNQGTSTIIFNIKVGAIGELSLPSLNSGPLGKPVSLEHAGDPAIEPWKAMDETRDRQLSQDLIPGRRLRPRL
jgi:hypothetical protein